MKYGVCKTTESALQCSHGVLLLSKPLLAVREQVRVFCICAHDMSKDPSPDLVNRVCCGYGAVGCVAIGRPSKAAACGFVSTCQGCPVIYIKPNILCMACCSCSGRYLKISSYTPSGLDTLPSWVLLRQLSKSTGSRCDQPDQNDHTLLSQHVSPA